MKRIRKRSKGSLRAARKAATIEAGKHLPRSRRSESSASTHYATTGKSFGYTGRIRGPVAPVVTRRIDDLPPDSKLRRVEN